MATKNQTAALKDFKFSDFAGQKAGANGLSGYGGAYQLGNGEDAQWYSSVPTSELGGAYYVPDGKGGNYWVMPEYVNGGAGGGQSGYRVAKDLVDPDRGSLWNRGLDGRGSSRYNGQAYDVYDNAGNFKSSGVYEGLGDGTPIWMGLLSTIGAGAGAAAAGLGSAAGAGAGLGGGAGAGAGLGAAELGAGAGLGFGAPMGAEAVAAYAGLTASEAAVAAAMGMSPEAFAALGAQGLGAAGAANGMLAGTAAGSTAGSSLLNGLKGLSGIKDYLGPISTAIGGLAGAKGEQAEKNQNVTLPAHLQGPVSDLLGRTQGLLGSQLSDSVAQGKSMVAQGQGLLSQPIAGNGYGAVQPSGLLGASAPNNPLGALQNITLAKGAAQPKNTVGGLQNVALNSPQTASNPYAQSVLDDLERRHMGLIQQAMRGVTGQSVANGGLGGSAYALAQAQAMAQGADNFTGQAANYMAGLYNEDQNRALTQYGMDQGYALGGRAQDISMYGMGLDSWNAGQNRNLQKYTADQSYNLGGRGQDLTARGQDLDIWNQGQNRSLQQFQGNQSYYTAQRDQDLKQTALGAGLVSQGQQAPWNTLGNAADIYGKWFGNGNTTTSANSGGGWGGALGGLLSGAGFANKMGWF